MAPVWPSPRKWSGAKKTSMEKKKERRKDWIWIKGIWGDGRSLFFTFSHFFSPLQQTLPQSYSSPIHPRKSFSMEVALHLLTLQLGGWL